MTRIATVLEHSRQMGRKAVTNGTLLGVTMLSLMLCILFYERAEQASARERLVLMRLRLLLTLLASKGVIL